jgi:polyisoprenoid-binding protein YceI
MNRRVFAVIFPAVAGLVALRCTPADSDAATANNAKSAGAEVAVSKLVPELAGLHLVVAPTGNEARYRIREQLVRVDFPNDAVGKTSEVSGGLGVGADGKIIPAESKFVVQVGGLTSDRDRRDNFVRGRVLETDKFPTVEFTPTEFRGLPKTLPKSGSHTFDVIGNLTVRGVTKPTTWTVTAEPKNGGVVGTAATKFTFADFGMSQPRVPIVLSVADTIKLEYDFTLVEKK